SLYADHRYLHSFPTRRSSDLSSSEGIRRTPSALTMVVMTPAPRPSGLTIIRSLTLPRLTRTNSSRPRREGILRGRKAVIFCGSSDRKSTRLNSSHDQISYAVF